MFAPFNAYKMTIIFFLSTPHPISQRWMLNVLSSLGRDPQQHSDNMLQYFFFWIYTEFVKHVHIHNISHLMEIPLKLHSYLYENLDSTIRAFKSNKYIHAGYIINSHLHKPSISHSRWASNKHDKELKMWKWLENLCAYAGKKIQILFSSLNIHGAKKCA